MLSPFFHAMQAPLLVFAALCSAASAPCPAPLSFGGSSAATPVRRHSGHEGASATPLKVKLDDATQPAYRLNEFRMVGVDFDFWPDTKSKWGECGVLTSSLADPDLIFLASKLNGSILRIGGSPADFMLYDVFEGACSAENLNRTQKHGDYFCPIWDQVVGQCLTMARWREINDFAHATGLKIVFDLNACWGRTSAKGEVDLSMIQGLLRETARGNFSQVYAFEFGNECYSNIDPSVYAGDMRQIHDIVQAEFAGHASRRTPKLVGPANGDFDMSTQWLDDMLVASGGIVHAATFHDYTDGCKGQPQAAVDLACVDSYIDMAVAKFRNVTVSNGAELWLGEGALAGNSGADGWTNVFGSSFYYANMLGGLARVNVSLMSRQTLLGGDYELINKATGHPYPDYWFLALWHQLVGFDVFLAHVDIQGHGSAGLSSSVRAFVHSALQGSDYFTVLLINAGTQESFSVDASALADTPTSPVQLYQLHGDPKEKDVYLNGELLQYLGGGDAGFPAFRPSLGLAGSIQLPPASIVFAVLKAGIDWRNTSSAQETISIWT